MNSCNCPHPPAAHAPVQDFGSWLCLHPGCPCGGTRTQAREMRLQRQMSPTTRAVYETVLEVLSNPVQRTIDDTARNLTTALIGNFKIEAY